MSHVINRQAPERLLLFVVLETTKFDSTEFRFPREAEAKYSNVLAPTFFLLTASVVQIQKTKTESMNSSSPAHSSISTTAVVGGGVGGVSNAAVSLDDFHFPFDPISTEERKDEAMLGRLTLHHHYIFNVVCYVWLALIRFTFFFFAVNLL